MNDTLIDTVTSTVCFSGGLSTYMIIVLERKDTIISPLSTA